MEICYLWVNHFQGTIKEQGYNFGSQLNFDFNYSNKQLVISENPFYVEGFFNLDKKKKIVNLTALVGKNGTGKSTFLKLLKGHYIDGGLVFRQEDNQSAAYFYKRILIMKINNIYKIFFHSNLLVSKGNRPNVIYQNGNLSNKYQFEFIMYDNNDNLQRYKSNLLRVSGTHSLFETTCIYCSNAFDNNFYSDSTMLDRRYFDISTKGLLNEIEKNFKSSTTFSTTGPNHLHIRDERFNLSLLKEHYIREINKRINLLNDDRAKEFIDKHSIHSEYAYLHLDYLIYRGDNFNFLHIDESQLLRSESNTFLNHLEKYIYDYIKRKYSPNNTDNDYSLVSLAKRTYLVRVVDSYFSDVDRLIFFSKRKELLSKSVKLANNEHLNNKNLIELIKFFMETTLETLKEVHKKDYLDNKFSDVHFKDLTNSYLSFISFLEYDFFQDLSLINLVKGTSNFVSKNSSTKVTSVGEEEICIAQISLNKDGLKLLNHFMQQYEAINSISNFIKVNWDGLSTGEDTILSLYARFFSLKQQLNSNSKNMIIILDEIEHSLHPEWQRQLIKNLVEYFPYIFSEFESIQIVLATNVPFLIADIPTNNIIYLEKNNEQFKVSKKSDLISQTFAANIHNLLINNFFMDSTIGEFAAFKIQRLIEILNSDSKNNEFYNYRHDINNMIETIGEPIIKNKLKMMYSKKLNETSLQNDIAQLIDSFIKNNDFNEERVTSLLNQIKVKASEDKFND